jgi:hypothetical protein
MRSSVEVPSRRIVPRAVRDHAQSCSSGRPRSGDAERPYGGDERHQNRGARKCPVPCGYHQGTDEASPPHSWVEGEHHDHRSRHRRVEDSRGRQPSRGRLPGPLRRADPPGLRNRPAGLVRLVPGPAPRGARGHAAPRRAVGAGHGGTPAPLIVHGLTPAQHRFRLLPLRGHRRLHRPHAY